MFDKSLEEIKQLITDLTFMKKEIKHSTIVDSNKILQKYEKYTENDSGFESEPVQHLNINDNFILPAYNLQEISFESSDLDELLRHLFKYVWQCLQQLITDIETNQKEIDTILELIKDFVTFLDNSKNDFFREKVVKKNLETLFVKAMNHQSEDLFNFLMELFIKLGSLKELYSCIFNIIVEKIKIFTDKVNLEKPDGSFLFNYERDFSRANTLMITALILKKENKNEFSLGLESKNDICGILETFAKHDDFFILEFISQKVFKS